MTFPQMRQGIAMIVHEALQCGTMAPRLKERQKRLQRHELARFYHWKQRNQLAPLNVYKREFSSLREDSRTRDWYRQRSCPFSGAIGAEL